MAGGDRVEHDWTGCIDVLYQQIHSVFEEKGEKDASGEDTPTKNASDNENERSRNGTGA